MHNFYNAVKTMFGQHYNADPIILDELAELPPILDLSLPPTLQEVLLAVRSLKKNKTLGVDSFTAELLNGGRVHVCADRTKVWTDETIPQQWRDANIVVIYKNKGDKAICGLVGVYHSFLLCSPSGKVLAKVLL